MAKLRRLIFWTHLTAGLTAGLVILVMSVTGICLAFEPQILNWAERDLRSVPPTAAIDTPRLTLNQLLARSREENSGLEPSIVTVVSDPLASVMVNLGRERVVYLNPYTAEVLSHGSRIRDWLQAVEGWHRWLGMSLEHRAGGRAVTGAADLVFFFLAISGFYLWWPRAGQWRSLRPALWPVGGLRGRARDCNWHKAIGFWCAPFLIVLTLTGVIMSYQWANNLLYIATGNQPPPLAAQFNQAGGQARNQSGKGTPGGHTHHHKTDGLNDGDKNPHSFNLDLLLAEAKQQAPDWTIITLRFPQSAGVPFVASIQQASSEPNFARSQLTFDSATGKIIKWEPFAGQNLGRKLRLWARFLHTGEAGGVVGQTIAVMASFGGSILVITGLMMACRRFLARKSIAVSAVGPLADAGLGSKPA